MPTQRTEYFATAFAVVEKLTGIREHFLFLGMTTIWAGDC